MSEGGSKTTKQVGWKLAAAYLRMRSEMICGSGSQNRDVAGSKLALENDWAIMVDWCSLSN